MLHDAWMTYDRRAKTKELVLDCLILFGFVYLIAFFNAKQINSKWFYPLIRCLSEASKNN